MSSTNSLVDVPTQWLLLRFRFSRGVLALDYMRVAVFLQSVRGFRPGLLAFSGVDDAACQPKDYLALIPLDLFWRERACNQLMYNFRFVWERRR